MKCGLNLVGCWMRDKCIEHTQLCENQRDETFPGRKTRLYSLRSHLQANPTSDDDRKRFACRANHSAIDNPLGYLSASIVLSVLHRPQPPSISGYYEGKILKAGQEQDFTCIANEGHPRPKVTWYENGKVVSESMVYEEKRVLNTYRLPLTEKDHNAVLECRVSSDLLEQDLVTNITLTVHYPPSTVRITAPPFIHREDTVNLECESSPSNPASSISWNIDGHEVEPSSTDVSEITDRGWITHSKIVEYRINAEMNRDELTVECISFSPAFQNALSEKEEILIVSPPQPPLLEGLDGNLIAGKSALLSCMSSGGNPPPTISLLKDGKKLDSEVSQKGKITEVISEIIVRDSDNLLMVACQVEHISSSTYFTTNHTMNVLFPASRIQGTAAPTKVDEGQEVTLSCDTSASNPPSNVTWMAGGVFLHGASQVFLEGEYGGKMTSSKLTIRAAAEDDLKNYTCSAENELTPSPMANMSITVNHAPIWLLKPAPYVEVGEGQDIVINASASSRPLPTRHRWWKDGISLTNDNPHSFLYEEGSLYLKNVNRKAAGNYTTRVENIRGTVQASTTLNVLYAPEDIKAPTVVSVMENSLSEMKCSAKGNPTPLIQWTKENKTEILSSLAGEATLFIENTAIYHIGFYLCTAVNKAGSVSAKTTKLLVKHKPDVLTSKKTPMVVYAHLRGKGTLTCVASAWPTPTFVWFDKYNNILQNSSKYFIPAVKLLDRLTLWRSQLEIRDVQISDYFNYRCEIHNEMGKDRNMLALSAPILPPPPSQFKLLNITPEGTATFVWLTPKALTSSSGEQKGDVQPISSYVIRYWDNVEPTYNELQIPDPHTTSVSLPKLFPGRKYTVTIATKNSQGTSAFYEPPIVVSLLEVLGEASSSSTSSGRGMRPSSGTSGGMRIPRLLLLITTLTGAALLALNIAIIACFVRRRKRERNISVSSSKTTSLGVYYAPQMSPSSLENAELSAGASQHTSPNSQQEILITGQEINHISNKIMGTELLIPVDGDQASRGSSFTSQKPHPSIQKQSIPLDLLEGSKIPLHDGAQHPLAKTASPYASKSNLYSPSPIPSINYSMMEYRQSAEGEDEMSLSSYCSNRTRSPKNVPAKDGTSRRQSLPDSGEKTIQDGEKTMKKKARRERGSKEMLNSYAHLSPSHVSIIDKNHVCASSNSDYSSAFKTLSHHRPQKNDLPKFATLQKSKTQRSSSNYLSPTEPTYATINIKTSPRHLKKPLKVKPSEGPLSPTQRTSVAVSSPSEGSLEEETPRYINLRTFRDSNLVPKMSPKADSPIAGDNPSNPCANANHIPLKVDKQKEHGKRELPQGEKLDKHTEHRAKLNEINGLPKREKMKVISKEAEVIMPSRSFSNHDIHENDKEQLKSRDYLNSQHEYLEKVGSDMDKSLQSER